MKKLLLLLFAITLIGCVEKEEKIINGDNDAFFKHEIAYFKNDTTLVTGKIKGWFENGQLRYEGTWKDGKNDGFYKRWHKNGQRWYEGTYKDGGAHGSWKGWHDNGQLSDEWNYKDGKHDGDFKYYDENGKLTKEETYKDGILISGKKY